MPKSIKKRNSKGGSFWDSVNNNLNTASQTAISGWNTVKNDVSEMWNKTKKEVGYSGNENYSYSNPSYSSSNNYTRGGKKRGTSKRRTRTVRGGYSRSVYPTLTSHAAPYHGDATARVKWIGGRKKQRRVSRKSRR